MVANRRAEILKSSESGAQARQDLGGFGDRNADPPRQ
jgi:hypothetical protein